MALTFVFGWRDARILRPPAAAFWASHAKLYAGDANPFQMG